MSKQHFDIIHSPEAETFLHMVTKGFYDNSYTGLWMYEAIGREWDEMRTWADEMKREINPQTCIWSIGIWEWVYGIATDETLQLEYRRQRILAKVLETKPVNIEVMRHGVARITGCDVDITDFAGPYSFALKIHMLENGNVIPYNSVREYIRKTKPSHLAAFLNWIFLVVINNMQIEQFFYPCVWLHWRIPFWDCYFLDGTRILDGSILLNAKRRYNLRIGLIFLMDLYLNDKKWYDNKVSIEFLTSLKTDYLDSKKEYIQNVCVAYLVSIKTSYMDKRHNQNISIKFSAAIEASENIGSTKVINRRNTYYLDGSVIMDGSRLLNAFYKEEEI